jgi:hypothetical protein
MGQRQSRLYSLKTPDMQIFWFDIEHASVHFYLGLSPR